MRRSPSRHHVNPPARGGARTSPTCSSRQARARSRVGGLLGTCVVAGALTLLVGLGLTSGPAVGLCLALMAACAPIGLVRTRARRRRAALRGVWLEVVDHLASGIRAGVPDGSDDRDTWAAEVLQPRLREFRDQPRTSLRLCRSAVASQVVQVPPRVQKRTLGNPSGPRAGDHQVPGSRRRGRRDTALSFTVRGGSPSDRQERPSGEPERARLSLARASPPATGSPSW